MVAVRFWFLESALASVHFLANKRTGYVFGVLETVAHSYAGAQI